MLDNKIIFPISTALSFFPISCVMLRITKGAHILKHQDLTKNTYNKTAETYASVNNQTLLHDMFSIFQNLVPSGLIYDFGCGTGRDTNHFHSLGYNVAGFDFSNAMLRVAREEFPHLRDHFHPLDLLKDLDKLPVLSANGIWCCACLLHFTPSECEKILHSFSKLLHRSGYAYVSIKLGHTTHSQEEDGRFFQYYTEEDFSSLLSLCGFQIKVYKESFSRNGSVRWGNYFVRRLPFSTS